MRQEKERFFQIIFEENSHVLFRYICGQLNNDRETAKDSSEEDLEMATAVARKYGCMGGIGGKI